LNLFLNSRQNFGFVRARGFENPISQADAEAVSRFAINLTPGIVRSKTVIAPTLLIDPIPAKTYRTL
jgi:hypothetical protein